LSHRNGPNALIARQCRVLPIEFVVRGYATGSTDTSIGLFAFGQTIAAEHGLILVDTKYEFGVDNGGEIILVDEIHTPDSSRYWLADSYASRLGFSQHLCHIVPARHIPFSPGTKADKMFVSNELASYVSATNPFGAA
jgi:phosphoribosylaminoimidazole-succinocarboxamide synthase